MDYVRLDTQNREWAARKLALNAWSTYWLLMVLLNVWFSISVAEASCDPSLWTRIAKRSQLAKSRAVQLARATRNDVNVFLGKVTRDLDQFAYAIFDKVNRNPNVELDKNEMAHIRSLGLEEVLRSYRETNRVVRRIGQFRSNFVRTRPSFDRNRLQSILSWIRQILLPLNIPNTNKRKLIALYDKFVIDPNLEFHDLTSAELGLLAETQQEDDFRRLLAEREYFGSEVPYVSRVRSVGGRISFSVGNLAAVSGLTAAAVYNLGEDSISVEQSIDSEDAHGMQLVTSDRDRQVELIYSCDPANRVMIRVRGRFYLFSSQPPSVDSPNGSTTIRVAIGQNRSGLSSLPELFSDSYFLNSCHTRVELKNISLSQVSALRATLDNYASTGASVGSGDDYDWAHQVINQELGLGIPQFPSNSSLGSITTFKLLRELPTRTGRSIGRIIHADPNADKEDASSLRNVVDTFFVHLYTMYGLPFDIIERATSADSFAVNDPAHELREYAISANFTAPPNVLLERLQKHLNQKIWNVTVVMQEEANFVRPVVRISSFTFPNNDPNAAPVGSGIPSITIDFASIIDQQKTASIDSPLILDQNYFYESAIDLLQAKAVEYSLKHPGAVFFDGKTHFRITTDQQIEVISPKK